MYKLRVRRYRRRAIRARLLQPDHFESPSYAPASMENMINQPTREVQCSLATAKAYAFGDEQCMIPLYNHCTFGAWTAVSKQ